MFSSGLLIISINAQIHISVNESCMAKNSTLLAQELIKTFGKNKVSELLDNEISLLILFNVDRLGNISLEKSIISNNNSNESPDSCINKF